MLNVFSRLKEWSDSRGISQQTPNRNGYIANKVEELGEYGHAMKHNNTNDIIDAIADSMVFDATELVKMGCDIELVLNEVLKVVESRTGVWDDVHNKFQKDTSDEAKANWYVPDYVNNCKASVDRTKSLFGFSSEVFACRYCVGVFSDKTLRDKHELDHCTRID